MPRPITDLTAAVRLTRYPARGWVPVYDIAWYVGRLHVSTRDSDIVRDFWRRGRAQHLPRPMQRALGRAALAAHRRNQGLYWRVMRGF